VQKAGDQPPPSSLPPLLSLGGPNGQLQTMPLFSEPRLTEFPFEIRSLSLGNFYRPLLNRPFEIGSFFSESPITPRASCLTQPAIFPFSPLSQNEPPEKVLSIPFFPLTVTWLGHRVAILGNIQLSILVYFQAFCSGKPLLSPVSSFVWTPVVTLMVFQLFISHLFSHFCLLTRGRASLSTGIERSFSPAVASEERKYFPWSIERNFQARASLGKS